LREEDLRGFLQVLRGDPPTRELRELGTAGAWRPESDSKQFSHLREPRPDLSVKPYYLPPRQRVAEYGVTSKGASQAAAVSEEEAEVSSGPLGGEGGGVLLGARACELRALGYLDQVLLSPPGPDPLYDSRRRNHLVVTVDCVTPAETCFCTLVDGQPYATDGFDLNLTPVEGGYVVEAGTERGEALLSAAAFLEPATAEESVERDRVRQMAVDHLESQNERYRPARDPAEALSAAEDAERWDDLAVGCVECGACTQICPTCHCFFLRDRALAASGVEASATFQRLRGWDSCMWSGYSRMAGPSGGKPNPRARFRTRFANRFLHKYAWSPEQWGMLGCVGCGRCTDACAAGIDIRQVIREMTA